MSWPKLQMVTSVDYNAESVFLNWTLGGFNAHSLHHLLPNISHVHYLNILPIFKETAKKHNINYRPIINSTVNNDTLIKFRRVH